MTKILLLNPPHTAIGSRVPREHLPPLGLLSIGGPLIDAGHDVTLLNADIGPMSEDDILAEVLRIAPDWLLIGHSGSSTAHPAVHSLAARLAQVPDRPRILYGGVHPTYHWEDILNASPAIDLILRGEGEATVVTLFEALGAGQSPSQVLGIAYRDRSGRPVVTRPAPMIKDLDAHRVGWELIDHAAYSYWGGKRAVVLQFSRGCPHQCTYCGQRGFWTRWRHRDPVKFAAEIARLVREDGIELINLADENPTSSRRMWKAFLEALIAENVDVLIVGSTRADDIVRDADILPLYKKAGVIRFLMGLEGTDSKTLSTIKKGGTRAKDRQAIQLLRAHGMIGLCTFAVGFEEETDRDYWQLLRTLLAYDPDQVMSIYATPHKWTPFFTAARHRRVVEPDMRRWDYKHQVLDVPAVPPWRLFVWVKVIEAVLQLRPRALWRVWFHPRPEVRHAMRWYTAMGRRVVLREVWNWLRGPRRRAGPTVAEVLGAEVIPEEALELPSRIAVAKPQEERSQARVGVLHSD